MALPGTNTFPTRLRAFSRLAGALVTVFGSAVFIGWALGWGRLIRLLPIPVVMNPVTTLAFVFAGVSLWRLGWERSKGGRDWIGIALASLVVLAGGIRLVDYLTPLHLPIEQLFFSWRVESVGRFPASEMAPNTALSFLLCGVALLLVDFKGPQGTRPAQCLILTCGMIAMLALIGYTYRIFLLYRIGTTIPMSLDTAIGFAAFSLGFLAARPVEGLMTIITSRTVGGAVARRLLPMAILIPWIIGALLLGGEQAGYYEREYVVSMFTVTSILIFSVLIWWNAKILYSADMERMEVEKQLRQASANLERSNAELQQFAYVASHDLSEPLRMVTSYLQLLSQRHCADLKIEAQEFIRFAVDGALRMHALIEGLLAYGRLDVRKGVFEPADSEQAFSAALANLKVTIAEAGATIIHEPLPKVMVDPLQLTQVFQNLLGNAIKFRSQAPLRLEVGAHRQDGEWLFFVRDNGIGIDPKHFDRIFVIFQRLHTRQEYAGTGMGLAICKKIVQRYGGRIWVESTPGKGSTFFFTLPAAPERTSM